MLALLQFIPWMTAPDFCQPAMPSMRNVIVQPGALAGVVQHVERTTVQDTENLKNTFSSSRLLPNRGVNLLHWRR